MSNRIQNTALLVMEAGDYTMTVLSDLYADMDSEVHRVLPGKVFPRQATVITAPEWIASV